MPQYFGFDLNIPCLLLVTGFVSAGQVVEGTLDLFGTDLRNGVFDLAAWYEGVQGARE
jgi:hypothetical protein